MSSYKPIFTNLWRYGGYMRSLWVHQLQSRTIQSGSVRFSFESSDSESHAASSRPQKTDDSQPKGETEKTIHNLQGSSRRRSELIFTGNVATTRQTSTGTPAQQAVSLQELSSTLSAAEAYEILRYEAVRGRISSVASLASHLMQRHNEAPNSKIYASLIHANIGKDHGSAAEVARLLQEMVAEGVEPDNAVYHDALKVLGVHPDALIRGRILEEMRNHWYDLSADGWHDVVAGHLREGQLEIALEQLDEMRRAQVNIQPWLYEITVFVLCDSLEIDEALASMQQRVEHSSSTISQAAWFHLFEVACERLHLTAIRYVWHRRVEKLYLSPTTGQCMKVLATAARAGDVPLAMGAFSKLRARAVVFESIHYEMLMQAYRYRDDLRGILGVTSIMEEAGIPLNQRALEQLSNILMQQPSLPNAGVALLQEMSKERKVPTATFNCLIEASVAHGNLEEAIDIYKQLNDICTDGADVNTFNALFRGCRKRGGKSEAMFFAAEMLALKIKPNALTYDRLLLVCLQERDYEDALRYYSEMRDTGFQPRHGTWLAMIKRLAEAADERAWGLLETMKEQGFDTELATRGLQESWNAKVVEP